MDGSAMRRKELTIFNVRRSNHETEEALELLQAHAEWFAPLLTHSRPLDQASPKPSPSPASIATASAK